MAMNTNKKVSLSLMMFLEFFIWGGWFVTLGTFLINTIKADGVETANAYSTQSWGAIIAPFIIGLIADRYFNAEKILGVLHLIGAVLLFQMGRAEDFTVFYPYVLGYMIAYMPTLALVNSVSFNQMTDNAKEFPPIRVWGTIGWILSGLLISWLNWDSQAGIENGLLRNTFYMTSGASAFLGVFSFFLPATPPKYDKDKKMSIGDILGFDALKLLSDRNYLFFFLASILICIPLAFYYQHTNLFLTELGIANPTGKQAMGQISEALFILALPIFLKRYGIKTTLLVGMFAWCLRYILFGFGDGNDNQWMIILGIILHGVCYDFFFVSGQIYTDDKAGKNIQSAAQGLITLATYGVGMLIGFRIAGELLDTNLLSDGGHNWYKIWEFPATFALVVAVLFWILFKNEKIKTPE